MKKINRITALTLIAFVFLSMCACGKKTSYKTNIFGGTDLSKYVTLGEYKSLTVDTSSDQYKEAYNEILENDVERNDLYIKKYEGKVQDGDIANIDYVGKKDGVAFDGGTAQGYDLTIGSHSFIDGFEDGLIGVKIGDTVDLNLTFPENYQSSELAGAAVVFTVTVNYVQSSDIPEIDSIYSNLGFKSAKEYEEDLKKRASKTVLLQIVSEASEIKDYPENDENTYIDAVYEYYDSYYNKNYNVGFEEVLKSNNMTVDDYKKQMLNSVEEQIKDSMICYAVLQKENLKAEYALPDNEEAGQSVLDEMTKVQYVVKDFFYDNAKIK